MYGWPYPGGRSNPVVYWIEQIRAGISISVVDDVWTEPLAAWDCARAIWNGIERGSVGSVNVSGGVRVSLYELALLTATVFDLDSNLIHPISSKSLQNLAPRPMDTSFTLTRLKSDLGVQPVGLEMGLKVLRDSETNVMGTNH